MNVPHAPMNDLSTRLHPRPWLLAGALVLALPVPALADAITDWNLVTSQVVAVAGGAPQQMRVFTIVHIATHDALNAIDPRYHSYAMVPGANPNASPQAAVARAARDVLLATLPTQAAAVDTAYANYLAGLPACPSAHPTCIALGETAGANAAQAILQLRHLDGSETPHVPYTLAPGPGVYQPTLPFPPAPAPHPQFGNWGNVKTFALRNSSQFAPGRAAMLNLASPAYARDYNEVKSVGSAAVRGAAPDSEESRIAPASGPAAAPTSTTSRAASSPVATSTCGTTRACSR